MVLLKICVSNWRFYFFEQTSSLSCTVVVHVFSVSRKGFSRVHPVSLAASRYCSVLRECSALAQSYNHTVHHSIWFTLHSSVTKPPCNSCGCVAPSVDKQTFPTTFGVKLKAYSLKTGLFIAKVPVKIPNFDYTFTFLSKFWVKWRIF